MVDLENSQGTEVGRDKINKIIFKTVKKIRR